jgi:hypothetical protein
MYGLHNKFHVDFVLLGWNISHKDAIIQIDVTTNTYQTKIQHIHHQNATTYTSIIKIILLSWDISTNPGPVKYPCGKCSNPVKRNQRGIYCEDCTYWYHIRSICVGNCKDASYN